MLPLDTPAGVEIVCIETPQHCVNADGLVSPIAAGQLHVLARWYMHKLSPEPKVMVCGIDDACFNRRYFRLLEKPRELYSLLERAPVKETV
jgi:hypothetical protein